jgi:membrane-associated phospholipid phosphatase
LHGTGSVTSQYVRRREASSLVKLAVITIALVAAQFAGYRWRPSMQSGSPDATRRTLAVSLCATAMFALYSDRFLDADSWVEARLAPIDSGRATTNPALISFVQHIADHDKPYYAAFALVLLVLEGLRRNWIDLGFTFATLAGGLLTMDIAKRLLDRPRPAAYDSIGLGAIWETPSGHTFITTVIAGLIYLLWFRGRAPWVRRSGAVTLAVLVLWVGLIRLLVGTHYPSDIVAGLGLGIAWLGVCTMFLAVAEARLRPHSPVAHTPSALEKP